LGSSGEGEEEREVGNSVVKEPGLLRSTISPFVYSLGNYCGAKAYNRVEMVCMRWERELRIGKGS